MDAVEDGLEWHEKLPAQHAPRPVNDQQHGSKTGEGAGEEPLRPVNLLGGVSGCHLVDVVDHVDDRIECRYGFLRIDFDRGWRWLTAPGRIENRILQGPKFLVITGAYVFERRIEQGIVQLLRVVFDVYPQLLRAAPQQRARAQDVGAGDAPGGQLAADPGSLGTDGIAELECLDAQVGQAGEGEIGGFNLGGKTQQHLEFGHQFVRSRKPACPQRLVAFCTRHDESRLNRCA